MSNKMNDVKVQFQDWGRITYQKAWKKQTEIHEQLKSRKIANRRGEADEAQEHFMIFCEHEPVYTLGKSGSMDHLLLDEEELIAQNIDFHKINRGGDITYHGPGQIVAYPIIDLDEFFTDVHKYVRYLEEAVIRTLKHYGLEALRLKDFTGVWLPSSELQPQRKICAIGVHLSRWVTMHGLAFNVNTDLSYFKNIVPCGINDDDKEVTSLEAELGASVDYKEAQAILKQEFAKLFSYNYL